MPKHTLIVTFPALRGFQNVHSIRNFAEDIHRHFMHNQHGIVEDMDRITDQPSNLHSKIKIFRKRAKHLIDELKKHHLFDDAIVTKREGIHESS